MEDLVKSEPVLAGALVDVVLTVAAKYGLNLDSTVTAAVSILAAVAVAWVVRHFVTPSPKA